MQPSRLHFLFRRAARGIDQLMTKKMREYPDHRSIDLILKQLRQRSN
jgi:hypothetical protein